MKKLFLIAFSVILLAGCSKEVSDLQGDGGLRDVTIKATLASQTTKAVADGDGAAVNVNRCIMEIYYDNTLYARKIQPVTSLTASFSCRVVSNRKYRIVFWADHVDSASDLESDLYYNTSSLQSISIKGTYAGNDDARDAFFHSGEYVVDQAGTPITNIKLYRPFAQVNVITTDWDKVASIESLKPDKVNVTIKNPMTQFNALTGEASAEVESLNYEADLYTTSASGTDATLSMDYIFAAAQKAVIDISWKALKSGNTDVERNFTYVPYQRNYRTNIKGNLLTSDGQWVVEVVPTWDSMDDGSKDLNVYYTQVASNADVEAAIAAKTQDAQQNGNNLQINIAGNTNDDVVIPDATPKASTPEIILNYEQLNSSQEIIIRDEKHEVSGSVLAGAVEYEGNVTVIVPEGTTADQVKILTNKSTVTVKGKYGTLIASCAPNTIVVDKEAVVSTLRVMQGNVVLIGKVTSIVREAGNPDSATKVFIHPDAEWTNIESEKSDVLVPVYPAVSNGSKQYFTLSEAMAGATNGGSIMILRSFSETPDEAVQMQTSEDVTIDADSPVTVTVAPKTAQSKWDNDGMAYFRSAGSAKNLTIGENVTLRFPADAAGKGAMYIGYASATPMNVTLNGHIEAYLPYVGAYSSFTINPCGSLTSVSECLIVRNGAAMNVDGTGAAWSETNPQINLGYGNQQGGVVTFKNTFVKSGAWWSIYNRNGLESVETKLVLDNTTFEAGAFSGSVKSSGTSSVYSVVLKNNSSMKFSGAFATIADATVTVEAGSTIEASSFDNKGVIYAQVPATNGEYLVANYTGSGSMTLADYGNVSCSNGYMIVKDNDLYVKVDGNVAMIGSNLYSTLAGAFAALKGGETVKFLADVDLNNVEWTPVVLPNNATVDGQNHTIKNLKITTESKAVGLIGNGDCCTIKNIAIDGANVTGINHVGVIAGRGMCTYIENCSVKNATVESKVVNNDDGDKVAAICGYLSGEPNAWVKNCSVEECTVIGYRDLGAIVGYADAYNTGGAVVSGNTAKNVEVKCDTRNNYKSYSQDSQFDANAVVGEKRANVTASDNTTTGVNVTYIR